MKVWCVFDDRYLVDIFSSESLARDYVNMCKDNNYHYEAIVVQDTF